MTPRTSPPLSMGTGTVERQPRSRAPAGRRRPSHRVRLDVDDVLHGPA